MKKTSFLFISLFLILLNVGAQSFPMDYSYVGFMRSEQMIPDAPVVVYVGWQQGDQSARLQKAIDWIAARKPDKKTGLRGAVLIGDGKFELSEPLRISADGIVVRGSGRDKTTLYKKGVERGAVIYLEGSEGLATGDTIAPAEAKAGEDVVVWQQSTKEWIAQLGCSDFGGGKDLGYWGWHPGEIDVLSTRTVKSVTNGQPVFDIPMTASSGDMRLIRINADKRMRLSGVENLAIDSETDPANEKDENHAWDGIYIANAKDCWVRMVDFQHLAGSAVVTQRSATQITVEDCRSKNPVSEIGGYRRRTFLCMGERCLFQRLYSEHGIHDFIASLCAAGPNVFSQCDSYESLSFSGSFGPWATGLLFDCVNIDGNDLKLCNIGLEGYGSGWTTTNSTAYQSTAAGIFADSLPDGSQNYVYGCWGQFNGNGSFAQCNNHVKPWSLFASQLNKRLGRDVSALTRTLERSENNVSNNPTYEQAAQMVALARIPRTTMDMWIDSARLTASIAPDGAMQVDKIKNFAKSEIAHKPTYTVSNGKLLVDGRLLTGRRQNTPWWNGRVRYSAFPKIADAVTRFVPEMEGQGTTTRVDSVAKHLKNRHVAFFNQHYGLWYDRRRDDHERIRRRNGDVWAPFYEQSIARSGQDTGWDGLSKYDLANLNSWYISRIRQLAEATAEGGMVINNQHYFQHNILEAGAHWVDCPWRQVNNINGTIFPEPVPFAGDKRVYVAEYFYNIDNPTMARLHKQYITNMLDAFADEPNIIQSISEEYTGPYHFTKFWIQTIGEWEQKTGKHTLVSLAANKNIQDSIMQDAELAKTVDIINIEQWWQTSKGIYAPEGGHNMAPRQYFRRMRPAKVTFADVYKAVSECRTKWQDKAVVYYGNSYDQYGWAVLMAGGSCPTIPPTDEQFLRSVATMNPTSAADGVYTMANNDGESLVYIDSEANGTTVSVPNGTYVISTIDAKTGAISKPEKVKADTGNGVTIKNKGIYWIRKSR